MRCENDNNPTGQIIQNYDFGLWYHLYCFSFQTTVYSSDIPEVRVAISLQQNFLELSFDSRYNLVNAEDVPSIARGKYKLSNANGLIGILDGQGHCLGLYSDPYILNLFRRDFRQFVFY